MHKNTKKLIYVEESTTNKDEIWEQICILLTINVKKLIKFYFIENYGKTVFCHCTCDIFFKISSNF